MLAYHISRFDWMGCVCAVPPVRYLSNILLLSYKTLKTHNKRIGSYVYPASRDGFGTYLAGVTNDHGGWLLRAERDICTKVCLVRLYCPPYGETETVKFLVVRRLPASSPF